MSIAGFQFNFEDEAISNHHEQQDNTTQKNHTNATKSNDFGETERDVAKIIFIKL